MSIELYYTNNDGDLVLATDRVRVPSLELTMMAEECAVGDSTIVIDDPDGDFYTPGLRPLYVVETEAVDDEFSGIIGVFWTWNRVCRRGPYRTGAAREVVVSVKDVNTLLTFRVQKGSDAEREQENDVERMTWLIDTPEIIGGFGSNGFSIDEREFFFEDTTVTMSETSYVGQYGDGVINDALQDSSKNAYLYNRANGYQDIRIGIWYGRTERTEFTSPHAISSFFEDIDPDTLTYFTENPVDLDYGSYTFAPSVDAELDRDPSRQITGAMVQWDGGNTYANNPVIPDSLTRRDMAFAGELVKNETQAQQRALSYAVGLESEDDAISCSVLVPAKLVNGFHQGHRVPVRFQHLVPEGYADEPVYMRVAKRTVRQLDAGLYEIALDLRAESPPAPAPPEPPGPFVCVGGDYDATPSAFYPRLGSVNGNAAMVNYYFRPGVAAPNVPTYPFAGSWHFPVFTGAADFNCSDLNGWRILVVGEGLLTLHTAVNNTATYTAVLKYESSPGVEVEVDSFAGATGVDLDIEIPFGSPAPDCVYYVDVHCNPPSGVGGIGVVGATWALRDA